MNNGLIKILKLVDAVVGTLIPLIPGARQTVKRSSRGCLRLLIIRPGGIGDAVLLLPALRTLIKSLPESTIDILVEKRNSAVFLLCSGINSLYHYDKPKELFDAMRGNYDIVIDTEQWHRLSAFVARMTRATMMVGYATNERKKLYTHPIWYSQDDYELKSFLNLLGPICGQVERDQNKPFLSIPPALEINAKNLVSPLGTEHIVAIFPGSSIGERKWGGGRFRQTAKLLRDKGYGIVVVGGKEDVSAGMEITSGILGALNLCGKLSLPETAAVLQESELLITGDSGIMHIGYGLGIKVLALFGPGREKKWAPRGRNCRVINKHLPCSPCTTFGYTPKCRKNAACMGAITVEEVVRESLALLEA